MYFPDLHYSPLLTGGPSIPHPDGMEGFFINSKAVGATYPLSLKNELKWGPVGSY